ncbi:hypothetical protein GQ457_07G030110 [Hibiscus cannabinus]
MGSSSRKRWALFKRLMKKEAWRWKFLGSAFKWKRLNIKLSFFDDVRFKIVSVLEAIYLVATLFVTQSTINVLTMH